MLSFISALLAGWLVWVVYRAMWEIREPVMKGERITVLLGNHEQSAEWFVRSFLWLVQKKRTGHELVIDVDSEDDTRRIIEILCSKPGYEGHVKLAKGCSPAVDAASSPEDDEKRRPFDARGISNKELLKLSFDRLVSYA